jgi:Ca-activated chloride channel homolog
VQPAARNAAAINRAVDAINPKGMTPISEAVRQAAQQLRYTEQKATVILITDGIETCNADPCALGKELKAAGVDFTAHVVGFGLSDEEGRKVACLAENTGGKYIQAQDGKALTTALTRTVAEVAKTSAPAMQPQVAQAQPAPPPRPAPAAKPEFNFTPKAVLSPSVPLADDAGNIWTVYRPNADGSRGDSVLTDYHNTWKGNLEPGDYLVEAKHGEAWVEQKIKIEAGKVYAPVFDLNAGILKIRPLVQAGGDPIDNARVDIAHPQGETTSFGPATFIVRAGEQKVKVRVGAGEVTETIALASGQTLEKDVVVGVGRAIVNAYYREGVKVDDGGLWISIVKPKRALDNTREEVANGYGPDTEHDLPAGDFVFVGKIGEAVAEVPFTIKLGERTDVSLVLNAGVLAVSAPGAAKIEVFKAAKDIQGKRVSMHLLYESALQTTLPAGDYVVVAALDGADAGKETPVTIKAGERAEVAVALR